MSSTIALTTSYQRLSTLMDAVGFNINNLVKDNLFIKNTSSTETVTIKFDSDTATADELGMHVAPLDNVKGKGINIGRCWLKTSVASNIDVSTQDVVYTPRVGAYSGISDDGTTVTFGEKIVYGKSLASTPEALTSSATIALDCAVSDVFTYTSGHTTTINASNQAAGQSIKIFIRSDGTNRVQTFGTGFTGASTLATGTDAALGFLVCFTSNGVKLVEASRTVALAFA